MRADPHRRTRLNGRSRRRYLVAGWTALALLGAACGGDKAPSAAEPTPSTTTTALPSAPSATSATVIPSTSIAPQTTESRADGQSALARPLAGTYHYQNQRGYAQTVALSWDGDTLRAQATADGFGEPIERAFSMEADGLRLLSDDGCRYDTPVPWMPTPGSEMTVTASCTKRVSRDVVTWASRTTVRQDGRLELDHVIRKVRHWHDGGRLESSVTERFLFDPKHNWFVRFEEAGSSTEYLPDGTVDSANDFGPLTWELTNRS